MSSRRPKQFNNKRKFKNQKAFPKRDFTKKEYRHKEQLSEGEVGIIHFISKLEGVPGVIKARFSDFHVNEIDLVGNVAKLTDRSIPKCKDTGLDPNNIIEPPIEEISQELWDKIKKIALEGLDEIAQLEVTSLTKDIRKKVHTTVKQIFKTKIVASTIECDEKKFIEFRKSSPDVKDRSQWPEDRGEYVHFLVYKEAVDTITACIQISDALHIKTSLLNYAGVKDKRAKTTQWFSIKKVEPWKLMRKTHFLRNIHIGNVTFKDAPLKLGDLVGNRFRIALRNVTSEDDIIINAITHLRDHGFVNYYGLQRFGNDKEVPTFLIGVQLLLGNWKEACELILKPKTSDDPEQNINKSKKIYMESGDAGKAYKELEGSKEGNSIESQLLLGLSKGPKNEYVNALESIPRNMRLLYIHSFQSLIWNNMVTRRIEKFGLKPVPGDFVIINDVLYEPEFEESQEELQEADREETKRRQEIKILTEADLDQYTIYDIVLPLPGYDIEYPENLISDYKEILESYGLGLEMTKQKVKTYTLSGGYRRVLGKIESLEYKIMYYNDPVDNLIQSDLEELKKFNPPKDLKEGKFKAVILSFSLNSACYATMVLREITKTDTSTIAQAKLNDYAVTKDKKILVEEEKSDNKPIEEGPNISESLSSSLLADSKKMEQFKNSIFSELMSNKRSNEINEDQEKNNKKLKTDEDCE